VAVTDVTGWRVVAASVEGTSHAGTTLGCQDAHAVAQIEGGLVIAVADGAGSAPRAGEGASRAVAAAVAHALSDDSGDDPGDRAAGCVRAARAGLEAMIEHPSDDGRGLSDQSDLSDLATTLLVVVATGATLGVAQVGDGAVVVDCAGEHRVVGACDRGEYLNETVFLTSRGWDEQLRVDSIRAEVAGVAVMSDGLQLLALDMATMQAHVPFFDPLWRYARSDEASSLDLATFLESNRVCARTDDDKTLVLAVPVPPAPDQA
jgi:hypothetical protein